MLHRVSSSKDQKIESCVYLEKALLCNVDGSFYEPGAGLAPDKQDARMFLFLQRLAHHSRLDVHNSQHVSQGQKFLLTG